MYIRFSINITLLLLIFLASVKAQKVRFPVIEDRAWDENHVVQTPVPKTIPNEGFIHFNFCFKGFHYIFIIVFSFQKLLNQNI